MKINSIYTYSNRQNFGIKFSPRYEAYAREVVNEYQNHPDFINRYIQNLKIIAKKSKDDMTLTIKKFVKNGVEQYKTVVVFDDKTKKDMILVGLEDSLVDIFKTGMKKMSNQKRLDKIFAKK